MKIFSVLLTVLASAVLMAFIYAKSVIIKGRVVDEKGLPVKGASIAVKGTGNGTTTDSAGTFIIEVPEINLKLEVTSAGFNAVEIVIKDTSDIEIKLHRSSEFLNKAIPPTRSYTIAAEIVGISAPGMAYSNTYAPQMSPYPQMLSEQEYKRYKQGSELESREGYDRIVENQFLKTLDNPLSTFSIDVDVASYSNVRRMLNNNQMPPAGAVRIEEMINYFNYNYPQPTGSNPFSINTEVADCPWNEKNKIVSIGLQGKKIPNNNLPKSNLTFLIDVSGSMAILNKLPLVKASLRLLTEQLREQDKVSIVVYAGTAGLVLPPTSGSDKEAILQALERLEAGGSTAGGMGIQLAYKTARENFVKNGNNRVILCTDGDFNVGVSSDDELERLIENERKSGIFLTVLGYGTGNYQDAKMQKLADKGNGNHAYIDGISEARKVLVNEFGGTLFTIAKDVKLQIEFNPAKVQGYRLIGYENRMLAKEDFNNDEKDAGDLGSGHTVTALYEIIPVGVKSEELRAVDDLKYQKPVKQNLETTFNGELMNIKFRYKEPAGGVSKLLQQAVLDKNTSLHTASDNLRFAAAVAQFGMLLRKSEFKGNSSYEKIHQLVQISSENNKSEYRKEFLELVKKAQKLNKDVAVYRE